MWIISALISVTLAAAALAGANLSRSYSCQVVMCMCMCVYFFFWQRSPRSTARPQENMPWVADNNPLYWQAFHTDQHLMGFIINRDDSFFRRLAFDGADKWRVDILQTASDWFCPSFRTDDGKREKGQKQLWLPTELSTATAVCLSCVYFSLRRDGKYGVLEPSLRLLSRPSHFSAPGSSWGHLTVFFSI